MTAGLKNSRVTFQRQSEVADGGGGFEKGWTDFTTLSAQFKPERGSERVESGRVATRLAGVLILRSTSKSREIKTSDRVMIGGELYQIRSISNPDQRNRDLEMTVESGAAIGD